MERRIDSHTNTHRTTARKTDRQKINGSVVQMADRQNVKMVEKEG